MTPARRFAVWILLAGVSFDWSAALAQPPLPDLVARAARRFPQPVRVGDLIGRQVLRSVEQQDVLGRVAGLVRRPDGAILVVVNLNGALGGVLGLNTRPVAVPVGAMVLLGEYMEVLDLSPAELRALPTFDDPGALRLAPDEIIRVGLQRPPH